jgi:hypothetical protein
MEEGLLAASTAVSLAATALGLLGALTEGLLLPDTNGTTETEGLLAAPAAVNGLLPDANGTREGLDSSNLHMRQTQHTYIPTYTHPPTHSPTLSRTTHAPLQIAT